MYLKGRCADSSSDIRPIAEQLLGTIECNVQTLKGFYTEDAIKAHTDEGLAWILFLDGCVVLYLMEKASSDSLQILDLNIKVDQLVIVQQDLLLLENQLPCKVFGFLMGDDHYEPKLYAYMNNFLKMHSRIPDEGPTSSKKHDLPRPWVRAFIPGAHNLTNSDDVKLEVDPPIHFSDHNLTNYDDIKLIVGQPIHLLDLLRITIIGKRPQERKDQKQREGIKLLWPTHRNIQELKALGIRVKRHKKNASLIDINFETIIHFGGRLYLSQLIVNDSTAPILLNLIAYEICPDFMNRYEISSYVVFLDSLIDNVDDVKELRKAGVLWNALGSDEEVTKLFNTISTDLVPDEEIYQEVRNKIEAHYRKKYETWIAQAYFNYFINPWAIIAVTAAFIALSLTFVQTWFAIYPSRNA